VPHRLTSAVVSDTALLVIDMLNTYEHEDADVLVRSVERVVPNIAELVARGGEADDIEVVYVNDNFGAWNSGRAELVGRVLEGRFRSLIEPIAPPEDTAFVVKARHSAFFETPLEYLLRQSDVSKLVLTGQVTEQCILYSALDAYIRHFDVVVPRDAVAHIHEDLADAALRMMELNMRAEITDTAACLVAPAA
jgi:nicotinamidase-related amidase